MTKSRDCVTKQTNVNKYLKKQWILTGALTWHCVGQILNTHVLKIESAWALSSLCCCE